MTASTRCNIRRTPHTRLVHDPSPHVPTPPSQPHIPFPLSSMSSSRAALSPLSRCLSPLPHVTLPLSPPASLLKTHHSPLSDLSSLPPPHVSLDLAPTYACVVLPPTSYTRQVVALHAWFLPALVEKCLVLMAMGDWDQAVETAQRVLGWDQQNIEALKLITLFLLSQASALTTLHASPSHSLISTNAVPPLPIPPHSIPLVLTRAYPTLHCPPLPFHSSQEARHTSACSRISELIEAIDKQEPSRLPYPTQSTRSLLPSSLLAKDFPTLYTRSSPLHLTNRPSIHCNAPPSTPNPAPAPRKSPPPLLVIHTNPPHTT